MFAQPDIGHEVAVGSGGHRSISWLFGMSLLVSLAIFSTTYTIGGFFLYPRALLALIGLVIFVREARLRPLLTPLWWLGPVVLLAAGSALAANEWSHLSTFVILLVRGVAMPYLAVLALCHWLGLTSIGRDTAPAIRIAVQVVCLALLIQAAVSVAHLTLPAFRTGYLESVNLADTWREMATLGLPRFSGIGGISIYDTAVAYCILGGALLLTFPISNSEAWLRGSGLTIILLLCLLHGRSGLFYALALFGLLCYQELANRQRRRSAVLRAVVVLGGLCFLATVFIDEELLGFVLDFAGELFINYIEGGGLQSDSTDDFVQNHLHLPAWDSILGGSALWAQPDIAEAGRHSYSTDSGYLLLLNFGGLPLVVATIYMLWQMISRHASLLGSVSGRKPTSGEPLLTAYLIAIFSLMSWKGPIFLSEHCMSALFLVLSIRALTHMRPHAPSVLV